MPVLNLFPKMKLQKALKVRERAYSAWIDACDEQDGLKIKRAWTAFKDADAAVKRIEAEAAR